ncbi:uncharacterized protein LOC115816476 [Chanos chanos]|uniref:asparaginase n=1 Tax=Chanos chanos TaxID=29144 RepID=A0A6J2VQP8_CHACN|nr:uncharacterized protein LOC115816476 [Chanos chanos]
MAAGGQGSVYVLYTGGTFGMGHSSQGLLEPMSLEHLKDFLIKMTILYEKNPSETEEQVDINLFHHHFRNLSQKAVDDCRSLYKNTTYRVRYQIEAVEPPVDSSKIMPEKWFEIATRIQEARDKYDGFVILHGTDTMAYTSSALSFILMDLKKPVVFTGAQRNIFHPHSDAWNNFIGAMLIAGCCSQTAALHKVMLFCDCKLFQGNRVRKFDCDGFSVFDSPNKVPLAYMDTIIKVSVSVTYTGAAVEEEEILNVEACDTPPDVRVLRFFPGIKEEYVRSVLEGADGVVLETFGSGNAPEHDWLKEALIEAGRRKVVMLNCTQVYRGTVLPIYALTSAGVVLGYDITPEAALTKMVWTLKTFPDFETRRRVLEASICGESSAPPKRLVSIRCYDNVSAKRDNLEGKY